MARYRTIKPEFWTSEQVMECSPTARLLFIGLWNFCDDGGNHPASSKTLKAEVFPGDDIASEEIAGLIGELVCNGLLIEYEVAGKRYWHVTGWHHQKIDKPTTKYPTLPQQFSAEYPKPQRVVVEDSATSGRADGDSSPTEGSVMESKVTEPNRVEQAGKNGASKGRRPPAPNTALPSDFGISERVIKWAHQEGHTNLEEHFKSFVLKAQAKGYKYADWDSAFMGAIREDWAGLKTGKQIGRSGESAPIASFSKQDYSVGVDANGRF